MKNKPFFALAVLILSAAISVYGQKGQLTIMAGPSFPVGDFAKHNLFKGEPGFAKTGEVASLSYSFPLDKKWNLLIYSSAQLNPLNTSAFEKELSGTGISVGVYVGSSPGAVPPNNSAIYKNWNVEKKSWFTASLHTGIQREWKNTSSGSSFTLTGAVGASHVSSPHLKGSSVTDTASATVDQTKESAIGFSYHTAAGFSYPLSKKIYFAATLIYFGTSAVLFKGVQSTVYTTKGVYGSPGYTVSMAQSAFNAKQTLNTLSLMAGVGIRL